ncbi:MAG: uncharacterized protein QOC96_3532 [Acidobacteriota bacterium]|jgi:uncharacterized protein|nr:uncharacterized protein [Acidobacteriota bacterium]
MIALLNSHYYRFVRLVVFLFSCLLAGSLSVSGQVTQSPIPQPSPRTPVVDYANVLDPATKERLNNILENLSENKTANAEFAVVTVKTTGDQDIFDFSLAVMRGWGIGSSDKGGLLLLVAVDDHKYFTQVSRHLEGDLPDGLVGQIQREKLVPQFKQGNYSKGISDTVEAYVATLAEKRGFSVAGIDQRQAYTDSAPAAGTQSSRSFPKSTIIIIIIVVIFLLFSSRRGGGGGGGCLSFLLLNSLFNSGRGGWGSSGWGGGGFGGGGGGGGGWGGFSGGGGDAGGGGAGGSW